MKKFVEGTKEVIILNLNGFLPEMKEDAGKDLDRHRALQTYIEEYLAGHLYPKNSITFYNTTLRRCWELDRRVILSYDHHSMSSNSLLWPSVKVIVKASKLFFCKGYFK